MQWCFVSEMKPRYCVLFRKPAVRAVADALHRWESSPRRNFFKSGCIPPSKSIPIRKNSLSGIIFPRRMHPYSEKFVARDYFPEANASLFGKFRCQGLFSQGECIPIRKISLPGIIFPRRMHPYSEKFVARDYFPEANASLFGKIRRQGLLFHGKCIPDELFRWIRMHSAFKMHPWPGISSNQDAFLRWKANIPSENRFFLRITVFLPQNHFSAFTRSW